MVERHVIWTPWDEPGIEHLRLSLADTPTDDTVADGLVVRLWEGAPFRLRYALRCDAQWRVRELRCDRLGASATSQTDTPALHLLADGLGHWTTQAGDQLPELDGCFDVDIMATPFTNTLPIRRLTWAPGDSQEIAVVYVSVPDLTASRMAQRYTCVERTAEGGVYRYESVASGYTALLPVDTLGLVDDYPEAWRRVSVAQPA